MLAGIVGDVVGSVYEGRQWVSRDLPLIQELPLDDSVAAPLLKDTSWARRSYGITDDTLCTLGLYRAHLLQADPAQALQELCLRYASDSIGFGGAFRKWLTNPVPYQSNGNGAIMRIGFVPFLGLSLQEQQRLGERYTVISHNHPDSTKAVTDYLTLAAALQTERTPEVLRNYLARELFTETVESLHAARRFEMNALRTLYQAARIVLESNSMEDVLRNSFYVGGDTDTLGCIACNLASAIYPVPACLLTMALETLRPYPELAGLVSRFRADHGAKLAYSETTS